MRRILIWYLAICGVFAHLGLAYFVHSSGSADVLLDTARGARLAATAQLRPVLPVPPPGHWPAHGASARLMLERQTFDPGGRPLPVHTGQHALIGELHRVGDVPALLRALRQAGAGDTILLEPGEYRVTARKLRLGKAGTARKPIHVRAAAYGEARLLFDSLEGFLVDRPFWVFENLDIRGQCSKHAQCEHAFHVVGRGRGFVLRNSHLRDFNAAIKANGLGRGEQGDYPDHGLLYRNTIRNTSARQTSNPVTHVDIVGASHWRLQGNFIADAAKAQGNKISYAAFFKGGGSHNIAEGNLVLCQWQVPGSYARVGLSLGGGGTGKAHCRSPECRSEQKNGVLRYNLVLNCLNDTGIHLNKASASSVHNNLLLNTAGISATQPASGGYINANLFDGSIDLRRGAAPSIGDNRPLRNCTSNWLVLLGRCRGVTLAGVGRGDFNPVDLGDLAAGPSDGVGPLADFCGRIRRPAGIGPWHVDRPPDCVPRGAEP